MYKVEKACPVMRLNPFLLISLIESFNCRVDRVVTIKVGWVGLADLAKVLSLQYFPACMSNEIPPSAWSIKEKMLTLYSK